MSKELGWKNGISAGSTFGLRHQIPHNLGNEVPVSDIEGGSGPSRARTNTANMHESRGDNSTRECGERSCSYSSFLSTEHGTIEVGTVYQRAVIKIDTRRVSASKETILGTAYVGPGVFLRHGRERDRRNNKAVYREPENGRREG